MKMNFFINGNNTKFRQIEHLLPYHKKCRYIDVEISIQLMPDEQIFSYLNKDLITTKIHHVIQWHPKFCKKTDHSTIWNSLICPHLRFKSTSQKVIV